MCYVKFSLKKNCFKACLFLLFCQFILFSCSGAENSVSEYAEEECGIQSSKKGYLSVKINSNISQTENSFRSALTMDEISSIVTTYELLLFNESEYQIYTIEAGAEKISVPAGEWNVICLAGAKTFLVGSGYVEDVLVEEGEITEISVNMYSIEISITADREEFFYNDTYKITVSIDTKNPYLIADYVYAGKKVSFKNSSSSDYCELEYTAGKEDTKIKYTTSNVYFKTENLNYKISECSDFSGIYNSTVIDKEGVTSLTIHISEKTVNTGIGLSINWME